MLEILKNNIDSNLINMMGYLQIWSVDIKKKNN